MSKKNRPQIRYKTSPYRRAEIVARSCFASLNKEKLAPESPTSSSCSLKYILIVDRSFDLISPLLHEFTYEAMLREIESSCDSEYCSEIKKELHLLDNTNLKEEQLGFWSLLRDVHLADCVSTLLKYSESFVASNSAAGFSKETTKDPSKLVSISQMKATIASIPELQEFKKYVRFSIQIDACSFRSIFSCCNTALIPSIGKTLMPWQRQNKTLLVSILRANLSLLRIL